ncbi:glycosyltransferase [Colwellia sp. BRX10-6]|uniref:glycosyltransferase family 2 protein n=1 Tax=unclassified Colwellia TaxID=196834 RepID=UPI0015F6596E|nr:MULTISPECIES: glycosyltransferase [unclassified Colwellia]MBA6381819.1 glycosyltransferase [Colwellia sp. BRX10-9]MBA6393500.1 glycosyltransferase [Colwellia sp. BRX10-6]
MSLSPLISVVIPAYNCEQYLKATVLSIIEQTYNNIEIIIINDGSSDSTETISQKLVQRFFNVFYFKQVNSGVSSARNNGLTKCNGDYICFLDGDDLWPATKIAAQVEFLENNPQYNFVCGDYLEVDHDFQINGRSASIISQNLDLEKSGWVYCKQLKGMHIHIITLMFRRNVLNEIYFDSGLKIAEDYDLWLRITANYQIAFLDACLAYYRRHPNSIMTKPQNKCYHAIVLERNVMKFGLKCKNGEEISRSEFSGYLYDAWFSHGYLLYHSGKLYSQCIKAQLQALRFKPYAITPWKYIIASLTMLVFAKQT